MTNDNFTQQCIAEEVLGERESQIAQWGDQKHPLVFSESDRLRFAKQADLWKQINAARVVEGSLTWDGILLEEVYEALGEANPDLGRAEFIQVSAVGQAIVESIDSTVYVGDEDEVDE